MVPVLIFSAFVIPANFVIVSFPEFYYVDYMLLMNANGFVPAVSVFFIARHIQPLFSLLMLFVVYPLAAATVVLAEMGIIGVVGAIKNKGIVNGSRASDSRP